MIKDIRQTELEEKIKKVKAGYEALPKEGRTFALPDRSYVREELIQRFQEGLDVFEEVRTTRAAYEEAIEARRKALPGLKKLHGDAIEAAHSHFGSDAKKMASFGVTSPERAKRRHRRSSRAVETEVVTEIIEEVITVEVESPPAKERHALPERERGRRGVEETHCRSRVSRGHAGRRR